MTEKKLAGLWRVHTPNLLGEIINSNPSCSALYRPLQIFAHLLGAVADRATELNDEELNRLMLRLTLYSASDPTSEDYNPKVVREYLGG